MSTCNHNLRPGQKNQVSVGQTMRKFFWDIYDNLGIIILSNLLSFTIWMFLALPIWMFAPRLALTGYLDSPLLNFLPFLLTLPVSSAGLFYVSYLIVFHDRARVRDFFLGLRRYFLRGLFLGFIVSFIFIMVLSSIYFYHQVSQEGKMLAAILGGINIWLFFLFILMEMYSFPLMVSQNIGLKKALKGSALLALDNPFFTIALSVQALAIIFLCILSVVAVPFLMIGLVSLLFSRALKELFGRYEGKGEREEERIQRQILYPWK